MSTQTTTLKEFSAYSFMPLVNTPPAVDKHQLDIEIERLRRGARKFVRLSLDERIDLARSMQQGYLKIAEQSVAIACKAKGIRLGTPQEGEEWALGPWAIVRNLRLVCEQLASLKETGNTRIGKIGKTVDGNLSVRVFPTNVIDSMLFKNVTVDVHLQKGVTADLMAISRAQFYKRPDHDGCVVLILGAGNLAMLPALDVITKMFNEGKVCMLKMNPVNAYIGPFFEKAFASAIDQGFLAVVYGGSEEGKYLVGHDGIDEIHITGSDKTHDAIVWGPPGPDREKRKASDSPLIRKRITSELGNVSPIIITPGPYTNKELRFMAEDIVGSFTVNSSFSCCVPKILVLPKGWENREPFLNILTDMLQQVRPRKAYYPGTSERLDVFTNGGTRGRSFGTAADGELAWTLLTGLDPENRQEPLFTTESFCPVLGETAVGSSDLLDFLDKAVDFVNIRLWGTLSATLVVHPKTTKDTRSATAIERAIGRLHYGTVCVNGFPGMTTVLGTPPWGAYPGSTQGDIQSGKGWVHNRAMIEGIEKVVARFPLTSFPKPAYLPSHQTVQTLMRRMTALEEKSSWSKVPGVVIAAMMG